MALGVATLVPLTLPGFGTSAVIDLSGGGSGDSIRVNPLVSIESSLNRSDPVELFTVDAPVAAYWRTVSLDTFDGVTWKATEGAPPQEVSSTTQPRSNACSASSSIRPSPSDRSTSPSPACRPPTRRCTSSIRERSRTTRI